LSVSAFHAIKCEGAFLNGERIFTSEVSRLAEALLATGFPYNRKENADYYLNYFKAFMASCQGIRRGGSAALELCYVVSGCLGFRGRASDGRRRAWRVPS
jgi:myo-inositol-1(or 4)-monophosphatase